MRIKKTTLLIALLILTGLTACFKDEVHRAKNSNEYLKVAVSDVGSGKFHPAYARTGGEKTVVSLVYEPLWKMSPNGSVEKILAADIEPSGDKREIVIKIKDDVFWNNGIKFTSEDVKFTLEYLSSPMYNGSLYENIKLIDGTGKYKEGRFDFISGIKVIDEQLLKIKINGEYTAFLESLSKVCIFQNNQSLMDYTSGQVTETAFKHPVGTGPYIIDDFSYAQSVLLTLNKNYRGKTNGPKNIKLITADPSRVRNLLARGEIDVACDIYTGEEEKQELFADGIQVEKTGLQNVQSVLLNHHNFHLRSKNFRKALMYAIDRKSLANCVLKNSDSIMNSCYPKGHKYYDEQNIICKYEYNPKKAKDILLGEESYSLKGGILYYHDSPVELSLIYSPLNRLSALCPPVIEESLKNIGIKVHVRMVYEDEAFELITMGEFDMALLEYPVQNEPNMALQFYSDEYKSNVNLSNYSNNHLDFLLSNALKSGNEKVRSEYLKKVEKFLNEEVPCIFLFETNEVLLKRIG